MEDVQYLRGKIPDERIPDFAERMTLPVKIWNFLSGEEILQEHDALKDIQNKRRLSTWERYYVSSAIPLPQTIVTEIAIFSYIGILNTSASLLESVELYPQKLDDLREKTRQRAEKAVIPYGMPVGADVTDAMIQPVTQMTLNSFKEAGAGKNMAGGITAARAVIDILSVKNPSATIFFRAPLDYEEVVLEERRIFNTIQLDELIVHSLVEKFNDLQTDWYNIFKHDQLYYRQFTENPDTLRIYFDGELLMQNQIDILQVVLQEENNLSISDVLISPLIRWGDVMGEDSRLQADRRVIILDIITPVNQRMQPIVSKILETPGRILTADYIDNPSEDMRIIGTGKEYDKIVRVFLSIDKTEEDLVQIINGLRSTFFTRNMVNYDLVLVGNTGSFLLKYSTVPVPDDILIGNGYYFHKISDDIPITNLDMVNFIQSVIFDPIFWILDIYPKPKEKGQRKNIEFTNLRKFFESLLDQKIEETIGNDIADNVYLFNKLLPKLRNLKLGGRDDIKEIFPKKFLLQNFVMSSNPIADGEWRIIFQERLMREYLLDTEELSKRLRSNGLVISKNFSLTVDNNWQVNVRSTKNPLQVLRSQPVYTMLLQSIRVDGNNWWLVFSEENKEAAREELIRLRYQILQERYQEETGAKNYMYLVNDMLDPQIALRDVSNSAQIVYAETDGGDFWKILGDERLNPYGCYINDANVILETLGIEAARNFLLHSLVNIMSQKGSLDIDPRHLLLFVDLVTRSGFMAKSQSLGEYEPASILERASLRAPVEAFASGVVEKSSKLGPLASIMMGFTPYYGSAANPRLIGREPTPEPLPEELSFEIPDILQMQFIESDQKIEGDIKEEALKEAPSQLKQDCIKSPVAITISENVVSGGIAPIQGLFTPTIIPQK